MMSAGFVVTKAAAGRSELRKAALLGAAGAERMGCFGRLVPGNGYPGG